MMYRFIYDENYFITIPACMIDSRAGTPLANKTGDIIKGYTDAAVAKVVPGTIPLRIESDLGSIVGNLVLNKTNFGNSVEIILKVVRSNFQPLMEEIDSAIQNYMVGLDWKFESL